MTRWLLLALLSLLAACDQGTLPAITSQPSPDDPAAPVADRAYRPVMAGTINHGVGEPP